MGRSTSFLFAEPSFLEGVARIMDFGNALQEYNYSENGVIADLIALQADWRAVGEDLRRAIEETQATPAR